FSPLSVSPLFPYTTLFRSRALRSFSWLRVMPLLQTECGVWAEFLTRPSVLLHEILTMRRTLPHRRTASDSWSIESYPTLRVGTEDRKSTRLNSSHVAISYA